MAAVASRDGAAARFSRGPTLAQDNRQRDLCARRLGATVVMGSVDCGRLDAKSGFKHPVFYALVESTQHENHTQRFRECRTWSSHLPGAVSEAHCPSPARNRLPESQNRRRAKAHSPSALEGDQQLWASSLETLCWFSLATRKLKALRKMRWPACGWRGKNLPASCQVSNVAQSKNSAPFRINEAHLHSLGRRGRSRIDRTYWLRLIPDKFFQVRRRPSFC